MLGQHQIRDAGPALCKQCDTVLFARGPHLHGGMTDYLFTARQNRPAEKSSLKIYKPHHYISPSGYNATRHPADKTIKRISQPSVDAIQTV